MIRSKRYAGGLLLAGLTLAVGTPIYLGLAAPHRSVYLLNPVILLCQPVPYVVCAGLWLPWRALAAARIALVLAGLLLLAALVIYVPMLWSPGAHGGDMIGFGFLLIATVTTLGVLVGSAVAALGLWVRVRGRRALSVTAVR
jgi:hypothetical protein